MLANVVQINQSHEEHDWKNTDICHIQRGIFGLLWKITAASNYKNVEFSFQQCQ